MAIERAEHDHVVVAIPRVPEECAGIGDVGVHFRGGIGMFGIVVLSHLDNARVDLDRIDGFNSVPQRRSDVVPASRSQDGDPLETGSEDSVADVVIVEHVGLGFRRQLGHKFVAVVIRSEDPVVIDLHRVAHRVPVPLQVRDRERLKTHPIIGSPDHRRGRQRQRQQDSGNRRRQSPRFPEKR